MLTSKKILGVLLLIGFLTVAGQCFLRYRALQRCLASGCVEFQHWEGWAVALESKMLGGPFGSWEIPTTAFLPLNRPKVVQVGQVDQSPLAKPVILTSSQMLELGSDLDLLGLPEELVCVDYEGLAQLFAGMEKNSRLRRVVVDCNPDFDDEAVSRLSIFPNLRELELWHPKFSGSGFPPLANLEKVKLYRGEADGRIFPALLACRALKEIYISSPNLPFQEAQSLKALPHIVSIYANRMEAPWDRHPKASNSFIWER